jgi:hypothetical protein
MAPIDKAKEIPYTDLVSRAAPKEGLFRVITQNSKLRRTWILGTYKTYVEAKAEADKAVTEESVSAFVHNSYGRVLYSVKD